MRVCFNPYRKKDGEWILYVNNDCRVSVAISEDRMPAPYAKGMTKGKRRLIHAISPALQKHEDMDLSSLPDYAAHTEPKARLAIGDMYITDVATIGGVNTGSDGAFLHIGDRVIQLETWVEL